MSHKALVRAPSSALERCELTHVAREPIDVSRAVEQHAAYCELLESLDVAVTVLEPDAELPDAPFVEDCALVLDELVVICRPGAEARRPESERLLPDLPGDRPRVGLEDPCTLDGGDVMAIDDVLYVGMGARTNHAGLKSLAHLVLQHGYRVKAAHPHGCLHLKTAVTHLRGELLLVNPAWLNPRRLDGFEWLTVDPDEPFGANALRVGEALVYPAEFPRTAARMRERGLDVHTVELSEFLKAEAGPTCLSLLFR